MTSVFPPMPTIPSIRQTSTASWPSVDINGTLSVQSPQLNKIYFNKKTLTKTLKYYNPNIHQDVIEQTWEIPFSVDVAVAVTELTSRIQRAMTDRQIYTHWEINFATFIIVAKQVTNTGEWNAIVK